MAGTMLHVMGLLLFCAFAQQSDLSNQQNREEPKGEDCSAIKLTTPDAPSGVYRIQPIGTPEAFQAYCEMRENEGWTVFQRRSGNETSFDESWENYKNGFGSLDADHWLGLENLWRLTSTESRQYILRVELHDFEGHSAFAEYQHFRVDSQVNKYKLHVGTFSGTAGDAIHGASPKADQSGFGFSTKDQDNDGCDPYCAFGDIAEQSCSFLYGGGWWFSRCGTANLNGHWHPAGENIGWASELHWDTWKGPPYSMKATRMMVKGA